MATIVYKDANETVADIAARNAITRLVPHMVVTVLDAIADVNAGAGVATYRWNESLSRWILISKDAYDSINFITEELLITGGAVTLSQSPTGNQVWDMNVVVGDTIIYEPRAEDYTISSSSITGLEAFEGDKLRVTYAYGTVHQQIDSYIDDKIAAVVAGAPVEGDTLNELYELINSSGVNTGTITAFEGALL